MTRDRGAAPAGVRRQELGLTAARSSRTSRWAGWVLGIVTVLACGTCFATPSVAESPGEPAANVEAALSPSPVGTSASAEGTVATEGAAGRDGGRAPSPLPATPVAPPSPGQPAPPEIGVMTMLPGEIFWERFGHDAIVVVDPATRSATSYNFGFFDLGEPDFTARFVRGDMRYQLVALPVDRDLATYEAEGRGVGIQWLDLPDADARQLAQALAENARPENARYRYDYFLDNCSTRVRDALDRALHGRLRNLLEGRSHGNTYRSEAMRLASPDRWMWLGFDIGLGPAADVALPLWDEAFVPMRLAAALREVDHPDGRPLVRSEHTVLPHRLAPEPQARAQRWWLWALAGLATGGLLAWAGRRYPRAATAGALVLWLVAGAVGALLLFLWLGTAHRFAWANHNLFLLNPLAWLLLPGGVRLLRGRQPGVWFNTMLAVVAALAAVGLFAHWLPLAPQRNAHWIALLLQIHLGLLAGLRRR